MNDGWFWTSLVIVTLAATALICGLLLPRGYRRWRALRERALFEDALKHLLALEQRGQSGSLESVAGSLGLSQKRLVRLITRMEAHGVLHSADGLRLTPEGERWALEVVRAHRVWERYLSDEAGVPLQKLHKEAERAEHHLSAEIVEALDAHLGYPPRDPHGDPIPRAGAEATAPQGVTLTDWPPGKPGQIVHLEDEPPVILDHILATGLRPGMTIRVLETKPDGLVLSDGQIEYHMTPVVAANIQVASPPPEEAPADGLVRLAELGEQEAAEVVTIDASCRGFGRRRLLDLGLTPKATVRAELSNPFGDPRAYRVRGTLIVLRREQAAQIWVRPAAQHQENGGRRTEATA